MNTRNKRVAFVMTAAAVVIFGMWQLPSRGADCSDLDACRLSVSLDLDGLPGGADDWVVTDDGVTLSPDETEAAVVLSHEGRDERHLAVFSTATGERRGSFEFNGATFFANPAYSTDGTELAAAVGIRDGSSLAAGSVVVWDRSSFQVNHQAWGWIDDGSENRDATEWSDCATQPFGLSNDGDYVLCFGTAQHVETGEQRSAYDYEPGFNTLPSSDGRYIVERVVYDPDVSFGMAVRLDDDASALTIIPRDGSRSLRIELDTGWQHQAIALDGPAERTLLGRTPSADGLARLLPPFVRHAGDLTVTDNTEGSVLTSHDVDFTPTVLRFSPSGASYVVLTDDLRLLVFDAPPS